MNVLFIFGTRPEAIKMAPIIRKIKQYPNDFDVKVCITAQHREMLDQVLEFFNIEADYDLNLMKPNQDLFDISIASLSGLKRVFSEFTPDLIFVQGDTTTAFIGALSAYYLKVKVAHLEAGLRSHNKFSPYPEEMNRILAGNLADYHFAPTDRAKQNLSREGIEKNVWNVGNTVIDALYLGLDIIDSHGDAEYYQFFNYLDCNKKIVLITGHRRESFGKPFEEFATALKEVANKFVDVQFVYPVHLNPNVGEPVKRILNNEKNIFLIEPLDYSHLIWLMNKSYVVVTDSGGIQEEAPSLGKPVLVTREVTERVEGIEAGTAKLVGTNKNKIISELTDLLTNEEIYLKMSQSINPYGDGKTSEKIVDILMKLR